MDPRYDDDFKLFDDSTIRRLQSLAAAPGDFQWRMEVLSKLERMRIEDEVRRREWAQELAQIKKDIRHLSPKNLALFVNAQIEQKRKEQESTKWRGTTRWLLSHVGTAIFTLLIAYLAYRMKR